MGGGGSTRRRREGNKSPGSIGGSGRDSSKSPSTIDTTVEGDICIFEEEATLASPKRGPLNAVSKGDHLDIKVKGASVVVVNSADDIVGSITESWVKKLKDCIELGHVYVAVVTSISGGRCDVIVKNK